MACRVSVACAIDQGGTENPTGSAP